MTYSRQLLGLYRLEKAACETGEWRVRGAPCGLMFGCAVAARHGWLAGCAGLVVCCVEGCPGLQGSCVSGACCASGRVMTDSARRGGVGPKVHNTNALRLLPALTPLGQPWPTHHKSIKHPSQGGPATPTPHAQKFQGMRIILQRTVLEGSDRPISTQSCLHPVRSPP